MVDKANDISRRYMLLFKLDAQNLYKRLRSRKEEYINIFAMKRSREHFDIVFFTKYTTATFDDLAHCSAETITALDTFYSHVEEIKWYLDHTEDMPAMIEDELTRMFLRLDELYSMVTLYIDAELGIKSEPITFEEEPVFEELPESEVVVEAAGEEADFGENPWQSEEENGSDISDELS